MTPHSMPASTDPPSFTHHHLPGDLHLALNSNKKMKTVLVTASFIGNLDETVTRLALLPVILRRGTRSLRDMQAISRHLDGLYGASIASYVLKIGEWHVVRFRLEVVNERFLPEKTGTLRKALEFLRELVYEPLEAQGGFQPEYLEQEKANLRRSIESLVDNKAAYAEQRLIEEMCPNEPYRIYEQGRIQDLESIDARALKSFHAEWVRRYPLHVYAAGDIDVVQFRDLLASVFVPGREGGYRIAGIPTAVPVRGTRTATDKMDVNQAKLVLGFRHGLTYAAPEYEALLLMSGILGGFSHSKLFQNVREKESLCYTIHSSLERTKGLLFISSGIAPENYQKAVDIILKNVDAMKRGEVTDDEIRSTVLTLLNSNEMLEDNFGALADIDMVWSLHGRKFDLLAFREKLKRVPRDEIVAVAQKLQLDTTYLLTQKQSA